MTISLVGEVTIEGARDFRTTLAEGDSGFRTFRVVTNDSTLTEADIIVATDGVRTIPAPLSLFPGSSTALCVDIWPRRDKRSTNVWIVTCTYKSILNQQELQRSANPNPIDRATATSGQSRTVMRPARRLLKTDPYKLWSEAGPGATWALGNACNSASDPLDPPIDVAYTEWAIHCEKNVASFPSWFLTHSNGVNTAAQNVTIRGTTVTIPKGCGKLGNFTFSPEKKENGTAFITIAWDTLVRIPRDLYSTETDKFGPWDEERLDEGMRTYDTTAGKWTNIPSSSGPSLSQPVPLNGVGQPINVTGARIAQSDLWWVAYRPFSDRVDYSVIPWS